MSFVHESLGLQMPLKTEESCESFLTKKLSMHIHTRYYKQWFQGTERTLWNSFLGLPGWWIPSHPLKLRLNTTGALCRQLSKTCPLSSGTTHCKLTRSPPQSVLTVLHVGLPA